MEAMLNFIPTPVAIALIIVGFVALAVGAIRWAKSEAKRS